MNHACGSLGRFLRGGIEGRFCRLRRSLSGGLGSVFGGCGSGPGKDEGTSDRMNSSEGGLSVSARPCESRWVQSDRGPVRLART